MLSLSPKIANHSFGEVGIEEERRRFGVDDKWRRGIANGRVAESRW